ncbi:tail fiber protein [Mucilaginibacter sp. HMF5004]|uniref:phage tail protein n=1 Tax=Mucilaginibacter rivuli TaxID=2857527 RepID=UPI001C5E6115|nr:tail fiber protein [Mucilaginibacter rivuli]MBW4889828.1 tail fiber protein [Mucilaginibacter rivuli]
MDSPFMGQIQAFGFNFAPRGWSTCQGQLLSIAQNTALFSLLGTIYGGNGQQTFQLPNLSGRVAVGQGTGPGLSPYTIGQIGGSENTTILVSNMPPHTHVATFTPTGGGGGGGGSITATLNASTMVGTQSVPGTSGANTLAAPTVSINRVATPVQSYVADAAPTVPLVGLTVSGSGGGGITGGSVTNAVTGSGLPINNLSPYLAINYSIALQGIFPPRN